MPAIVGSHFVQSANFLAVFYRCKQVANSAICVQILRCRFLPTQQGQRLSLRALENAEVSARIVEHQPLSLQSLSRTCQPGNPLGTSCALVIGRRPTSTT